MTKEKLLLEMGRTIDIGTLLDLIAAGLPDFILNIIDKEALQDTADLFNEVSKFEYMDKYDIGSVDGYEARIDLLVDKYCSKRPYRCTIEDKKEIKKDTLDTKLIEESYSPYAAPVTLALKKEKNRKSRLCID
ncbi:unnamed protein product [Euphydryas editha]|uniref:Uncharacterized protein n=1 Tax=Euphydryas editha TaxID=104508 RepID=A0AAU9UFX5_EUPED|nr:unnamed protein product [Euphydryas editha]